MPFPGHAQENVFVNRTIKLFAWEQSLRDLQLMEAEGPREVIIPNGAPTRAFDYRGDPVARFGTVTIDAAGEVIFTTVAGVQLPDTANPILLIFFPQQSGSEYRIVPFVEDLETFVPGTMRLINLSGQRLIVRLGNNDVNIRHGDYQTVKPDPNGGRNITVLMAKEGEDGWSRAYSARWGILPERRLTVFILPGQEPGRITLRRIAE